MIELIVGIVCILFVIYAVLGVFHILVAPFIIFSFFKNKFIRDRIEKNREQYLLDKSKLIDQMLKLKDHCEGLKSYHSDQSIKLHKDFKVVKHGSILNQCDEVMPLSLKEHHEQTQHTYKK